MATTTLKKFTTIQEMFSTTPIKTAFPVFAGLLVLSLAGPAQAGKDCGGLNQKSCWNINPAKWCNTGLKYVGTPEKDSRPIGAEFVRLLRVNQAGKRRDIKWARSQKAGLQMTAGALIADQAIRKL